MSVKRFDADNLIIGDGELVKNGSVVIEKKKIIYAGESEHAPNNVEISNHVSTILPGLWDCHGHFWGLEEYSLERIVNINPSIAVLRSLWDAQQVLSFGFTSIREVGGYGVYVNRAIQEGFVKGPRIYGSRAILSTTGGHVDLHSLPLSCLPSKHPIRLTNGVDDCIKAVREQIREGAELIKYCASGGIMSVKDSPINQQFSQNEQKAIVQEATRSEIAVAAHCHGELGIKSAIKSGVTTIEHGSYLTDEIADQMVEKNIILVPTRFILEKIYLDSSESTVPSYIKDKLQSFYTRHLESLKLAIKKNVIIAMGTDMGLSGVKGFIKWGQNAQELELYVKAGMKPMDAIVTATGNGPKTLGPKAPRSGILKKNNDADLLLLKTNPLNDITSLQKKENFVSIYKLGFKTA